MGDVRRKMGTMKEALKRKALTTIDELIKRIDHLFTLEVMARPLPNKFKLPHMKMFNGGKDTLDHLKAYKTHMNLQVAPDEIMC